MINRRAAVLLTFTLALSACGFKLKGLYEVPESLQQLVLVETSAQPTALGRELINQLSGSGVVINESAPYRLELGQPQYNKRALTLSARAEALEYELSGKVIFTLYQMGNEAPVLEREVSAARTYDENANSVALESLENSYRTELNRALADQIVRQYLSHVPNN